MVQFENILISTGACMSADQKKISVLLVERLEKACLRIAVLEGILDVTEKTLQISPSYASRMPILLADPHNQDEVHESFWQLHQQILDDKPWEVIAEQMKTQLGYLD